MAKYIYNCSGVVKNYHGLDINNNTYYQIPENLLSEYQTNISLLHDILEGQIKSSLDGVTTYSNDPLVNLNFIKDQNIYPIEVDSEGRQLTRIAAAKHGWTYLAKFMEFETSKINSLKCRNYANSNTSDCTIKFYNSNNEEVTDVNNESTIVKSEILFKPNYDYEIISGHIHQIVCPNADIFVSTIGGIIELGANYTKEFCAGMNLAFMGADEQIITDGRASKYMTKDINGVPYQANQLKTILFHPAGYYHRIMICMEHYRA